MIKRINKLLRRTAIVAIVLAAAWLAAGYWLGPPVVERWIARYGAGTEGRSLAAERVAFNPITLDLALDGVEAREAAATLTAERVRANLSVRSLPRLALVLDELSVERARLALAADGLGADWRSRLPDILAARTRALPGLSVTALALREAELDVTRTEAGTMLSAGVSLSASEIDNTAGPLAVGAFLLRAEETDGAAIELSGRVARAPTVISGRFVVERLDLARLAERLGAPASGVLGARGLYSLTARDTLRRLELSEVTAEITGPSLALAAGGAASAGHLSAELDTDVDIAAGDARASGRVTLSSPALSRTPGEPPQLAAERLTAEDIALTLPPVAIAAASARVDGWRARVDVGRGDAPQLPDWALTVDELELAAGSLDLVDTRTAPPVEIAVEDTRGRIAGFEAGGLPREIAVEGQIAGTANGTLSARLGRSGPRRLDRTDFSAEGIEARMLSPYAERFAGWRLDAGAVDLALSYRRDGRATGFVDWAAEGLELTPLDDASAPSGDTGTDRAPLPLGLAVALATGPEGRLEISAPLEPGVGAGGERVVPDLPGLAGAALARHVGEAAGAPFDVLARVVDAAEPQTLRAVPFQPGSAALPDTADTRLATLAQALAARPRLGVGAGGAYAASVDRQALAAEQVRTHVALATAVAARSDPSGPLDFASPRTQDVLDEFAGQRLSADVLEALAARFESAPDAAPSERVPYYEALFAALAENEPVSEQMRNRLARYRARTIADALAAQGLGRERVLEPENDSARPAEVDDAGHVLVPLVLETLPNR